MSRRRSRAAAVDISTIRKLTRERDEARADAARATNDLAAAERRIATLIKERDEAQRLNESHIQRYLALTQERDEAVAAVNRLTTDRDEWARMASRYRNKIDEIEARAVKAENAWTESRAAYQEARADLAHDEAVLLRQRELLIRLRAIAEIGANAARQILLIKNQTTRHDLFGSRCIVLGREWSHVVLWARAFERDMAELAIDGLIPQKAKA